MNPRRIKIEEMELMALRWARRSRKNATISNIESFIAGFKMAHDELFHNFSKFLINEGNFYQREYIEKRKKSLKKLGFPLTEEHYEEFNSAMEFGKDLAKLGNKYTELKLLM